ncbi:MAG TPA: hypothetical protein VMV79_02090 [Alphaproteobacteria bacterium]|nr:hypothetical protein [Alphaproteobacteria bacterium]
MARPKSLAPVSPPPAPGPAKGNAPMPAPWSCRHHADGSSLEAYNESAGEWIAVARTVPGLHVDHVANAALIARAVNDLELDKKLIRELAAALEGCLHCGEHLTWEAEQEAHVVLTRARLAIE